MVEASLQTAAGKLRKLGISAFVADPNTIMFHQSLLFDSVPVDGLIQFL
jgi:hypothetical protein